MIIFAFMKKLLFLIGLILCFAANTTAANSAFLDARDVVAAKGGENVVYQGIDKATNTVKYIGITERAPAIRFAEHLNSGTARSALQYDVVTGAQGLTRTQARIWEQTLINQYGLGKNGGQLFNQINSIAPKYWWQYGITP